MTIFAACPRILRLCVSGLVLCVIGCVDGQEVAETDASFSTVVDTVHGRVVGQRDNNALSWLGVPFAKPPIGDLRWRAPRDPDAWTETLRAASKASPCAQEVPWGNNPGFLGSEDCLYLNVYRPASAERNLPVYFWIHGGGNFAGSALEFKGDVLAEKLNAVVVITQFRLGRLGFFSHPGLREDTDNPLDGSGNYGFLDQIKALQWVQDNVAAFGGNPDLVTVAGESMGAYNITALMGAEPVKREKLFHRAIYQSGAITFLQSRTLADEDDRGTALLELLQVDGIDLERPFSDGRLREQLNDLDSETVTTAGNVFERVGVAVIDGVVFKESLRQQFEEGSYYRVPILVGGNKDEYKLMAADLEPYRDLSAAVKGKINESDISLDKQRLHEYAELTRLITQVRRAIIVDEFANILTKHQPDVFVYDFVWDGDDGSLYQFVYGAAHALDIPFFHGDFQSYVVLPYGFNDANQAGRSALSDAIISYQKQFIRSGDPANGWRSSLAETWQPWSSTSSNANKLRLDASATNAEIEMIQSLLDIGEVRSEIESIVDPELRHKVDEAAFKRFGNNYRPEQVVR